MKAADFPVIDSFLRWARTQHETGTKNPDDLVADAIRRYGANPVLLESLIRESLRLLALEAITGRSPLAELDDELATKPTVRALDSGAEERIRMSARRRADILRLAQQSTDNPVSKFFERHPDHAVTVPLLALTREELFAAADVRDAESRAAIRRAMLCRRIAEKLQPGQVAGDVFSEEEVERLAKTIHTSTSAVHKVRRAS